MRKNYGEVEVIHGVDLDINDGEFVVFVGPSGCGKSTLLRMIAGLEDISSGTAKIGENIVNDVAASKRGVAMVFQTYAEVEFLKAEAAIRGWISTSDKDHYEAGVTAGMQMLEGIYGTTPISGAEISTFLAGDGAYKSGGSVGERWEQVMDQYFIATYLNEYEAYANWRRSGFPNITATRHPGSYTNGQFMVRMIYPTAESGSNVSKNVS